MVQWNVLLIAFLAAFVASSIFRLLLTYMNVSNLRRRGHDVPEVFRGEIDEATLARMSAYTADSSRFGAIAHLFDDAVTLLILLSGFLPLLSGMVLSWKLTIPLKSATCSRANRPAVPIQIGRPAGAKRRWFFSSFS